MLIPTLPLWLFNEQNFSASQVGLSMGVFAIGLYLLGPFCSYLVQHYRRNAVCMWAVVGVAAAFGVLWYADRSRCTFVMPWVIVAVRLFMGAAFGLSQMVLASTLIIDITESYQRTEANHSSSWFSRFGLSLGPLIGILFLMYADFHTMLLAGLAAIAIALLLIGGVQFPFRVPSERFSLCSTDRFLLFSSWPLWLFLLAVGLVTGMVFSLPLSAQFYGFLMVGFLLALLAQRYVFREAELKSEVVSGLLLLLAAILVILSQPAHTTDVVAAPLMGCGVGITASRLLLFFIKMSRHCQRGTSQSTCLLAWESGLSLGIGVGYAVFYVQPARLLYVAVGITVALLFVYTRILHDWFLNNKNR